MSWNSPPTAGEMEEMSPQDTSELWFAWHPVIAEGRFVWLKYVRRDWEEGRMEFGQGSGWVYYLNVPPLP